MPDVSDPALTCATTIYHKALSKVEQCWKRAAVCLHSAVIYWSGIGLPVEDNGVVNMLIMRVFFSLASKSGLSARALRFGSRRSAAYCTRCNVLGQLKNASA